MNDAKWFGFSRSLYAWWAPVLALFLEKTGAGQEVFGQVELIVEGALAVTGGLAWLWHYATTEGVKKLTLLPKISPDTLGSWLLVAALAGGAFWLTGCGLKFPNMAGGAEGSTMTKERCQTFVAIAQVAIIECDRKTDELDRRRCVAYAKAAIAAARQWCAGYPSELEGLEIEPAPATEEPTPPGPPAVTPDEYGNWAGSGPWGWPAT